MKIYPQELRIPRHCFLLRPGRQCFISLLFGEDDLKVRLYFIDYYSFVNWSKLPQNSRSSHPEVFLGRVFLKICSKITEEHPCQSAILTKLQSNLIRFQSTLIEITLRHGCSPLNLLYILRTSFPKSTSLWLLLEQLNPLSDSVALIQKPVKGLKPGT